MKKFTTALLTSASIMFAASSAHAIEITDYELALDDFGTSIGEQSLEEIVGDTSMSSGTLAVVGGVTGVSRMVSVQSSGNNTTVRVNATVPVDPTDPMSADTFSGVYSHSQDSGVGGISSITYTLDGVDLTVGGDANAFRIEIASFDISGGQVGVLLQDDAMTDAGSGFVTIDLGNALDIETSGGIDIPFSLFDDAVLADAGIVQLYINGFDPFVSDLDISIDSFGVACSGARVAGAAVLQDNCAPTQVSEPASLGLLGLGLVGLGAAVRRRKA